MTVMKDYVINSITVLQGLLKEIHRSPDLRLGEILVDEMLGSREQLNEALIRQKHSKGKHLGQILIEMELVTQQEVTAGLARKLGIPFVSLQGFELPAHMLSRVPAALAIQYNVVPLGDMNVTHNEAMESPLDP